jgi:RNA polymerase sigma-70 factor, ECF subfamily
MIRPTNPLNETPEPQLAGDARTGNRDAIAELFRRYYPHSIAVARRILPAREEFLDAVQSAYLSAFRSFQSFRGDASFKTWITRIVLNQCLMRIRQSGRHPITLSLDQPAIGGTLPSIAENLPTPEALVLRAELERAIADTAAKLPKELSDVFARCGSSGLSIRETAEALGLTVQATKTRLFRARALVRQKLQTRFASRLTAAKPKTSLRG